jgi:DNA-directed RNA polymerase specialized sigma24 family protein
MIYDDPTLELAEMLLGVLPELKSRRLSGDNTVCERIDDIEKAIEAAGLTDKQRRALELVAIQGYTREEAAEVEGVSKKTMFPRVTSALRKFMVAYGGIERYVV